MGGACARYLLELWVAGSLQPTDYPKWVKMTWVKKLAEAPCPSTTCEDGHWFDYPNQPCELCHGTGASVPALRRELGPPPFGVYRRREPNTGRLGPVNHIQVKG